LDVEGVAVQRLDIRFPQQWHVRISVNVFFRPFF
jgi:hypothetical protein